MIKSLTRTLGYIQQAFLSAKVARCTGCIALNMKAMHKPEGTRAELEDMLAVCVCVCVRVCVCVCVRVRVCIGGGPSRPQRRWCRHLLESKAPGLTTPICRIIKTAFCGCVP